MCCQKWFAVFEHFSIFNRLWDIQFVKQKNDQQKDMAFVCAGVRMVLVVRPDRQGSHCGQDSQVGHIGQNGWMVTLVRIVRMVTHWYD